MGNERAEPVTSERKSRPDPNMPPGAYKRALYDVATVRGHIDAHLLEDSEIAWLVNNVLVNEDAPPDPEVDPDAYRAYLLGKAVMGPVDTDGPNPTEDYINLEDHELAWLAANYKVGSGDPFTMAMALASYTNRVFSEWKSPPTTQP